MYPPPPWSACCVHAHIFNYHHCIDEGKQERRGRQGLKAYRNCDQTQCHGTSFLEVCPSCSLSSPHLLFSNQIVLSDIRFTSDSCEEEEDTSSSGPRVERNTTTILSTPLQTIFLDSEIGSLPTLSLGTSPFAVASTPTT